MLFSLDIYQQWEHVSLHRDSGKAETKIENKTEMGQDVVAWIPYGSEDDEESSQSVVRTR